MKTSSAAERTNAEWLADLHAEGQQRESALADLRLIVVNGLRLSLAGWVNTAGPEFEALAEDFAQETLLKVLAHLGTFEGRSLFTTWVHKIAVRVALTELRRRRWQDVSLEGLLEQEGRQTTPRLMADPAPGPDRRAEQSDLLARVQAMMREELTERQLRALTAVGLKGMPLEEVARRMGMKRNALYKLLHDARLRLKRRLAREGLSPQRILAVFERG